MTLHITHNDLDGIGCGILVKACIPSVHTVYSNYDELESLLEQVSPKYSTIIITDIAPSEAIIQQIAGERELMLIDHHVSSEPLKRYHFVTHAIGKCATKLTYEKFTELGHDLSRYENFVDCVNDFDLWLLKRDDSLKMNLIFNTLGIVRFEKRFFNEPYTEFRPEESLIIELEEEERDRYITRAAKNVQIFADTRQRQFAVVFAEMYASELGNHIVSQMMVDYAVIINSQRKKISLRSSKDTDISEIAIAQGGGGHKNAAGFSTTFDFGLAEFLNNIELIR
ncbi:MAG: phosphoesterase [Deferribacteraceae bacterium]|nr:phosphoesterase [Deferribacteraceae bacterium]